MNPNSSGQMEADWGPEGPSDLKGLSSTIPKSFSPVSEEQHRELIDLFGVTR